jgi:hypothetical protein
MSLSVLARSLMYSYSEYVTKYVTCTFHDIMVTLLFFWSYAFFFREVPARRGVSAAVVVGRVSVTGERQRCSALQAVPLCMFITYESHYCMT